MAASRSHRTMALRASAPLIYVLTAVAVVVASCGESGAIDALTYATERAGGWFLRYRIWLSLHYALGLTSVVLSVVSVAYKSARPSVKSVLVLSAAIAAGVLTFFNPSAKARAYHRAWQGLDNALIIYNTSSTPNGQDLIAAEKSGENLLPDSDESGLP